MFSISSFVPLYLISLLMIVLYQLQMRSLTLLLKRCFNHGIAQPQNMKRFYKQSTFEPNSNSSHPLHRYLIKLDNKTMRTPYRHVLAVPSPILALLVTSEFNRQDQHLKTGEMPMLALCRTAVDADIEGNIAEHLTNTIIEYLKTDTLIFYEDYYEKEYNQTARPLVDAFSKRFNIKIKPSSNLEPPQVDISPDFEAWMKGLNNWELIGLETMTVWLKSTIGACSLIESGDIMAAQQAATLEETVQMKQNGEVEEKLMNLNQIRLMISSGLMMFEHGKLATEIPK